MAQRQITVTRSSLPDEGERLEVERAFSELGMEADVRGTAFAGPAEFVAGVTVATALTPFLQGILGKAGEDSYLALKRLLGVLWRFGRGRYGRAPEGAVSLDAVHARIQLEPTVPDHALKLLLELDITQVEKSSYSVTVYWSDRWSRWLAQIHSQPARRLPIVSSRSGATKAPTR
jgi:hypothetical protein